MVTTHLAFFFFNGMGGGGDVSTALTGQAVLTGQGFVEKHGSEFTAFAGDTTVSSDVPLTGVEATFATGTVTYEAGEPPPEPEPEVVVQTRARRGRRIRIIEDPERLEEEILKEEKIVEKDKKKLVVLFKQQAKAEGFLYQQIERKIEQLEARVDDRMQKIAELIASMPEIEDDEEEEMYLLDS